MCIRDRLPGAVLGRGVVINVIMNVALVDVGTNEKLVLALSLIHIFREQQF